jgi:hypothetical protein
VQAGFKFHHLVAGETRWLIQCRTGFLPCSPTNKLNEIAFCDFAVR